MSGRELSPRTPAFGIAVAAALVGLHPQTLRQYDRLGLVVPARPSGRARLYSLDDVTRLARVAELTAAGFSLPAIVHVLALEAELERLRAELASRGAAPGEADGPHPRA